MSRTSQIFLSFFITWIITRLFYWLSGFDPIHNLNNAFGYLIDLGIWSVVWFSVVGIFEIFKIGKKKGI
jgi:hypothetical protein